MKTVFITIPKYIIGFCLYLFILVTPLLAFWLASSLAAFLNGPLWVPLIAGLLLFPVFPLLWDLHASARVRKRAPSRERYFTFGQRFVLRTLFLSLFVISITLLVVPQKAFLALAARGDWPLDFPQVQSIIPQQHQDGVRETLFTMANGLEWLYKRVSDNPYEQLLDDHHRETIKPTPESSGYAGPLVTRANGDPLWPWPDSTLHPLVTSIPSPQESNYQDVAKFIDSHESDPYAKVKALHDFVADRIVYDVVALNSGNFPPQDAATVFQTRKSVCAGYANLLMAMGQEVGIEIITISGDARSRGSSLSGMGHAWNAVKIEGKWYLIDATWDSGYVSGPVFTKEFKTDYLFTPPHIMGITHLPDDPAWQLREKPLSRGEFLRQPMLKPRFFINGLKLLEPSRSITDAKKIVTITVENPHNVWMTAHAVSKENNEKNDCTVSYENNLSITCLLPKRGTYEVQLFSSTERYGSYPFAGQLEFNNSL